MSPYSAPANYDAEVRRAALQWVLQMRKNYPPYTIIPSPVITAGLHVPGHPQPVRLLSQGGRGIWKPAILPTPLSIKTSYKDPYGDTPSLHGLTYKYTKGGPQHSDNRSLREAIELQRPILHFQGIAKSYFTVDIVLPVGESEDQQGVDVQVLSYEDALALLDPQLQVHQAPEAERIYRTVAARHRLHQSRFRQIVLSAYGSKCAICQLKKPPLLDAAHILPDSRGGEPEVSNGLSLCRIHHGAYDQNILGISPDHLVHINQDLLVERDGPMLQHGFQEMHHRPLHLPRKREDYPDSGHLDMRFSEFKDS